MTKREFTLIGSEQRLPVQCIKFYSESHCHHQPVFNKASLNCKIFRCTHDENLTWECHINKLSKKSASGISTINVLGIQSYVRLALHLQFLSATSTPLLQLGWASCWKSHSQKLQKLQNRAAHNFFKLQL